MSSITTNERNHFRMHRLFTILALICCIYAVTGHRKKGHETCRYWCRTAHHQYYCCPSGEHDKWIGHDWHAILHPLLWITAATAELSLFHSDWPEVSVTERETEKHCPPLRTHCPRTHDWYMPPISCDADADCDKGEKCCYDVCLEHKTCKQSEWEK